MAVLALEDGETKHLICCQDSGHVDIIVASNAPQVMSYAQHNSLGMIYKIEKLPIGAKDKNYQFALASNNGVGILSIKKDNSLKQKLEGEKYL